MELLWRDSRMRTRNMYTVRALALSAPRISILSDFRQEFAREQLDESRPGEFAPRRFFVDRRKNSGIEREIGLYGFPRFPYKRHRSEHRSFRKRFCNIPPAPQTFEWLGHRHFFAGFLRHLDPVAKCLGRIDQRFLDCGAHRAATIEFGEHDAV